MKKNLINLENSTFYYDPFPHCLIENFLDDSFYQEICKEFPKVDFFRKLENKKSSSANNSINKFNKFNFGNNVKDKSFSKYISSNKALSLFYDYINSDFFLTLINDFLLKNYIELKIGQNGNSNIKNLIKRFFKNESKSKFDFEFSLIPANNGFILPHTDGWNKILSFVIPIIDDDKIYEAKNIGTKIYKPKKNEHKFNLYNKTVPFEDTEEIREMPFRKNQMYMHVKTFNSLHGVGPIQYNNDSPIYRKSISMFLINNS